MSTAGTLINAGVVLATNETFQNGVGSLISSIFGGGSSGPPTTPEQKELRDNLQDLTGYTRSQIQSFQFLYRALFVALVNRLPDGVIIPGEFLQGGITHKNIIRLLRENGLSS